jgi:hypothetical protein
MDSKDSLRAILAKYPRKSKTKSPQEHVQTPAPTQAINIPKGTSRPVLVLPSPSVSGASFARRQARRSSSQSGGFFKASWEFVREASSPNPLDQQVSDHARSISWLDQPAHPAPPDRASKQTVLRSKDDNASSHGSTVSLASTLELAFAPSSTSPSKPTKHSQMKASLAAARKIIQFKGSIWDPEDEEWLDAGKVAETFHATYKSPATPNTLSPSSTPIWDTIAFVLASPSTRTAEEEVQAKEKQKALIDELGNTYYSNPEGDLNDELMKDVRLGPTRFFPGECADTPRCMHVLSLDGYFNIGNELLRHARPRLCDAVATVLSHTSKECVKAFLNPSIEEFTYRRKVDNNEGGLILIIRRYGNEVICGAYHNLGFKMLWKLYVKSRVNITGKWYEVYATTQPAAMVVNEGSPEWGMIGGQQAVKDETLEATATESVQRKLDLSQARTAKSVEDADETNVKFVLYQSRVLAMHLLWDVWSRLDQKSRCKATWMADGIESIVRLRSSLVGVYDEEDDGD